MLLEINSLKKRYSDKFSLNISNLIVKTGSVVSILGPNGSGKTTLIKAVLNLISNDSGEILFNNKNHYESDINVGYLPEISDFMNSKTLHKFYKDIKILIDKNLEVRNEKNIFLNSDYVNQNINTLSKGYKQRGLLEYILNYLSYSDLFILDEPFSGLDHNQKEELIGLIKKYKSEGKSFLIMSHEINKIESICDSVYLLSNGHFIDQKSMSELLKNYNSVSSYYESKIR